MTEHQSVEIEKMRTEREKLMTEIALNGKKIRYFESTLLLTAFAVGIAVAKLFLD